LAEESNERSFQVVLILIPPVAVLPWLGYEG
jgi:hypothetical protein